MKETRRLTALQREALIQYQHDPGSRGLSTDDQDTESRVELEVYVCTRDVQPATAEAAA